MHELDEIAPVLRRYPALGTVERLESLYGAGGFSGARLWRVGVRLGTDRRSILRVLCLRRWPSEHPDESRLVFIHHVLQTVYDRGVTQIPLPLPTDDHATFVRHDARLWELTPWMPGEADYHRNPSREKLRAAMQWLAKFHNAAAPERPHLAPSPGIAERLELVRRLLGGEADEIVRRLDAWPESGAARHSGATLRVAKEPLGERRHHVADRARRVFAAFRRDAGRVEQSLMSATTVSAPLQPCIRDIWRDHVLFEGDRVSGVVDFGALRVECVAADIARLLGSLVGDDVEAWRDGVAAYDEVRELSECERRLITAFDESGMLLSGMNWLRWIYLEGRTFEQPERVVGRLDDILTRLERPRRLIVE